MAKNITLNHVDNLKNQTSAVTTVNDNFDKIETALVDVLSLSGELPNQMENNLDMNSHQIINLPAPNNNTSPLRLQDLIDFQGGGIISTLPNGGTTNQVLTKHSDVDYDVLWKDSVISVGLAMPTDEYTVSGSPVTSTGTLTVTKKTQPANYFLGGPASGADTSPVYRTLQGNDLPLPTTSAKGGVKAIAQVASKWIDSIDTAGNPTLKQPSVSDLSDTKTGTGNVVLATSPTLTTPNIGAATATSVNKLTLTAPATSATLTVANGKTLTASNTLTFTGTDGVTIPFGTRTRQVFSSSSGTYTSPANVKYLMIKMVGAGGGGAGGGTSGGAGGTGGTTTFGSSLLTCTGGAGGQGAGSTSGGAGGTATGGTPGIKGGTGGNAQAITNGNGGQGAASPFGSSGNLGTAAAAAGGGIGPGSGGGGGGNATGTTGGGGGGAGAYLEALITSPSGTYAYSVGAAGIAGTAGTSGNAGGAGAAGIIIVDEFYQ